MPTKEEYTVPAPDGYKPEDLSVEGSSVLGAIYLGQDLDLVIRIVERTFDFDPNTNIRNIHKIFATITSDEWQKKHDGVMAYMYDYYLEMQSPNFVQSEKARLQFAYALMLLEGYIYRAEFPESGGMGQVGGRVVKPLFDMVYKDFDVQMSLDCAELISHIRNGITHHGGLSGLSRSLTPKGYEHAKRVYESEFSEMKDLEYFLDVFVSGFRYLFEDMMLRFLGLTQKELGRNLNPPCKFKYWVFELEQ